jgi:hypothetical protein
MRVIDPGHKYALSHLDGVGEEILTFVKREGVGYPGNVGHYEGTNLQEMIRVGIHRMKYLDNQIHDTTNNDGIEAARDWLWALELRAARRHGRTLEPNLYETIEHHPVCSHCGHVGCEAGAALFSPSPAKTDVEAGSQPDYIVTCKKSSKPHLRDTCSRRGCIGWESVNSQQPDSQPQLGTCIYESKPHPFNKGNVLCHRWTPIEPAVSVPAESPVNPKAFMYVESICDSAASPATEKEK